MWEKARNCFNKPYVSELDFIKKNPSKECVIIYNCQKIMSTWSGRGFMGTPYITMNEFEKVLVWIELDGNFNLDYLAKGHTSHTREES